MNPIQDGYKKNQVNALHILYANKTMMDDMAINHFPYYCYLTCINIFTLNILPWVNYQQL
jgi:hypothetical protein